MAAHQRSAQSGASISDAQAEMAGGALLHAGSTREDGPITWYTNDLASDGVTWIVNPLAQDMDPVEYVGRGLGDLSQLQTAELTSDRSEPCPPIPQTRSRAKPRLSIIIPERPESFEIVPTEPSASTAPLGPPTPSEVTARSSPPALTPLSQLYAYFFPAQEESGGDLSDTKRGPPTTRRPRECRYPGRRRAVVIFTPAPVAGMKTCERSGPAAVPHRTSARQQRCAVRQAASRLCAAPGTFRWPAAFTGSGCSSPARAERVHARQAAAALRHVALVRNRRAQAAW